MRLTQRAVEPVMGSRAVVALLAVLGTLLVSSLLRAVPSSEIAFANLNPVRATPQGHRAGQKLLVLTPLKDGAAYLDAYFANLQRLNYPPRLISLAFLVSDSTDDTIARLQSKARRIQATSQRFADITILQKDFHFKLPNSARHGFEGQPVRRAFIARARNYLLTAALKWDHAWVLWLDVDVVRYDPDILMDLMRVDKDIVVPNTLWYQDKERQWDFWGFDRNNFAETEESLALIKRLGPDVMLVEGYRELVTHRLHLVDMPTHFGFAHVPLDGIGCTFTLVKAHVHREGVTFPTYTFDNQIETEGLAKMAKRAGFEVVGIPGLVVFHAQNH